MKKVLLLTVLVAATGFSTRAQQLVEGKKYKLISVGFYNLENLFDTIVDPDTNKILQDEFTPLGKNQFNSERYFQKLENLSKVLSEIGTETTPDGLAVIGVSEIENREVLEDLVAMPALRDRNYKIVHYHSPDRRGIDVGLLYQEKYFQPDTSFSYRLIDTTETDFYTRDQLLVSGKIEGEAFHFMVSHWPSRRGGQKRSEPKRILAAELGKHIMDSILREDPAAKIIYMGDLNDDPTNNSVKKVIGAKGKITKVKAGEYFNPMEELFLKGIGTLAWRDNWNLFDQLICSSTLVETGSGFSSYKYYNAKVFNAEYLKQSTGSYKGYPFRTYVGGQWMGGYSDHFPVYLYLIKEY